MIRILTKSVADKIAAGEVIDRPVSIIKELVENSIDAGATALTVEIRNGGKSYIRVTDNGCGIPGEEAELAFTRHATSKIATEKDLDAINTLGFRGEALASICAVARVELVTKTADSKTGRKVVVEGSETVENTAIGCPEGTTVTVRDLFYNVPARHKFLASDSAETRRIVDIVSRIALSYGDVKITLINGSKTVFATRGKGKILDNIISIYGTDTSKDLLPVEKSANGFILKGYVSSPATSAPSRTKQIFCVNGRVISSRVMERALDEAYREKLFHGRFPIAFLFLAMPPEKLDVNIHPTKKEIRFDDNYEVEDFVKRAVIEALTEKEALPQIRSEDVVKEPQTPETKVVVREPKNDSYKAVQENFKKEQVKFAKDTEQVNIKNILTTLRETKKEEVKTEPVKPAKIEKQPVAEPFSAEKTYVNRLEISKPTHVPFEITDLNCMGTIFNTYILATDADTFYLIDQHAAHERIFYEKLLKQYNEEQKSSQQLLLPLSFNVSASVTSSEEEWLRQLIKLGYNVEFFGNNTYLVREIPAFMELQEAEYFLNDFFTEIEHKIDFTNVRAVERVIMRSCKSAVKGGDSLNTAEINALMKDLANCINPFSCPHGRPTFIRMTKYEIEKMFKRV